MVSSTFVTLGGKFVCKVITAYEPIAFKPSIQTHTNTIFLAPEEMVSRTVVTLSGEVV